ncbi:MAG: AbrB/MazE/SpoVT family DNA-binding domain-containing protein [Thermoplasmataceae archaeon]
MVGNIHEATIDNKGRILLSKKIRKSLGLSAGMKVKLNVESDRIIIEKVISPDEFITRMKGFIKKGSNIPASEPLFLKQIWK